MLGLAPWQHAGGMHRLACDLSVVVRGHADDGAYRQKVIRRRVNHGVNREGQPAAKLIMAASERSIKLGISFKSLTSATMAHFGGYLYSIMAAE